MGHIDTFVEEFTSSFKRINSCAEQVSRVFRFIGTLDLWLFIDQSSFPDTGISVYQQYCLQLGKETPPCGHYVFGRSPINATILRTDISEKRTSKGRKKDAL